MPVTAGGSPAPAWDVRRLELSVERRFRQLAVPAALLVAWGLVHAGFPRMLLRIVLSMWVHESGHAVAAWLCGRLAFPGPWFTPIGGTRSWFVVLVLAAAMVGATIRLWPARRGWAIALALLLPLQIFATFALSRRGQDILILWAGDGGCLVIGTLLMLSFYAKASSSLRKGWLRWGFLVIGAAAFADAFATWWAARTDPEAIPFGENEGRGLSDPTVLVFEHGLSVPGLISSYVWTAVLCLAVLVVAHLLGLRNRAIAATET